MSNRYGEELPHDITERELYRNALANQTITKASALIGGSIAVAFNVHEILKFGFDLWVLFEAAVYFACGFILFTLVKSIVFFLRHMEVHPAVIYLVAAIGPVAASIAFLLALG